MCICFCRRLPWTRGHLGHVAWCVCVYLCAAACPGHVGALATLLGVSVCICVPPVALDTWAPWPRCLRPYYDFCGSRLSGVLWCYDAVMPEDVIAPRA